MKHLELGFIGFGLIGGSIARSVKKKHLDLSIKVYTRRHNPHLEKGVEEGIIDELLYSIDEHFSSCDIIFLCAPVLKNIDFLSILKPLVNPSCIITDVGSVKGNICRAASELGLGRQFIGGHPMAGSEKTGYEVRRTVQKTSRPCVTLSWLLAQTVLSFHQKSMTGSQQPSAMFRISSLSHWSIWCAATTTKNKI